MQQPMPHQIMGYDRAITMFSPDGRLLQVEYAKKTVRQGSTAIGMVCKDGVALLADKRIVDSLVIPEAVEKIWQVDDHVAATASGILSDARVLVERAQLRAQQHHVTYDAPIDVLSIVKDISNLKQFCTQSGGLRPFGVSLLIAGVDDSGAKLFETDPTGIYFQYRATVIGEGEPEIEEVLRKEYRDDLSLDEAFKLGLRALYRVIEKDFNIDRIAGAFITLADKRFTKLKKAEIERYMDDIRKSAPKKKEEK
ncbi:archaeal proteasome endopeptidase complex subunit alpha [Candidatus Woesearchaeota archaeon]|nr:archaeal proteasome endopeptidase complex subunit alpha [Candidatus Woesearchaeota archaeon]